jgi:hypothetical protein
MNKSINIMAVWGQEKWRFICAQDAMAGENALHSLTFTVDWLDSLIGLGGLLMRIL